MAVATINQSTTSPADSPSWDVARTWLLVPGRPDGFAAFDAARDCTTDMVILDLEDGLPVSHKADGRRAVRQWLTDNRAWVRISTAATADWSADLSAIADAPGLAGVVLAKTESPTDVSATAGRLGARIPVIALIESALGVEMSLEIARHPQCVRLAFGVGDFRRDTGMSDDPMALAYPRSRMVVASRAAAIASPIDGPTPTTAADRLDADTTVTATMGMTGRLVLNCEHADTINTILSPSASDIADAQATVTRLTGREITDGSELPKLGRAQELLVRAGKLGLV